MALNKFTSIVKDFVFDTDGFGVEKDTWLTETNPTWNQGGSATLFVGKLKSNNKHDNIVLFIKMPSEQDILGFDELEKVELLFMVNDPDAGSSHTFGILEFSDTFDEGTQTGALGEASWDDRIPATPWTISGGAVATREGSIDDAEFIIDSLRESSATYPVGALVLFDITGFIDMGESKSFAIVQLARSIGGAAGVVAYESSRSASGITAHPIMRLTWKSFPPIGFEEVDDRLKVEPNPDDPEEPKLTWGAVRDVQDFSRYTLYRDTSPITDVSVTDITSTGAITAFADAGGGLVTVTDAGHGLLEGDTVNIRNTTNYNGFYIISNVTASTFDIVATWVATETGNWDKYGHTITDPATVEYIDDDTAGWSALVAGTTYYYLLAAEDQDNNLNAALLSASVVFTKPDTTVRSLSPSGAQNVGTKITLTVTSVQKIKRVYVDWKDDSQSWYEFETVGLTKTIDHIYSKDGGPWAPDVRIQDDKGFWSTLLATTNNVTINDTSPIAKLLVNVKETDEGDEVTLAAHLSQPKASNATITKYEFKRFTGDSWQDNGTNPVISFSTSGFGTGTQTAQLRITTSTSLQDTDSLSYNLISGDPTNLIFSPNTSINEIPHVLPLDKMIETPIGADRVEHEFLISRPLERVSLVARSTYPEVENDIGLVRTAWLNNTFVRVTVTTEMENKTVRYDGKIDGDITLGQRHDNQIDFTFPMRVITRTEV